MNKNEGFNNWGSNDGAEPSVEFEEDTTDYEGENSEADRMADEFFRLQHETQNVSGVARDVPEDIDGQDSRNEKRDRDILEGRMSTATAQLGRVYDMSYPIQRGIRSTLMGTLDASNANKDSSDIEEARSAFASITGMDPVEFAKMIKIDDGVRDPNSKADINTALRMLREGEEYLYLGPGEKLEGNATSDTAQARQDEYLYGAKKAVEDLAELYLDERTLGTARAPRKQAIVEALIKRFSKVGYKGSKALLPLPNETGVVGIRPTMSFTGGQGTSFDRLSFSLQASQDASDHIAKMGGIDGIHSADIEGTMYGTELFSMLGSLSNSLFPVDYRGMDKKERKKAKRTQKFKTKQAYKLAEKAREGFAYATKLAPVMYGEDVENDPEYMRRAHLRDELTAAGSLVDDGDREGGVKTLNDSDWFSQVDLPLGTKRRPLGSQQVSITSVEASLKGEETSYDEFEVVAKFEQSKDDLVESLNNTKGNLTPTEGAGSVGRGGQHGYKEQTEQEAYISAIIAGEVPEPPEREYGLTDREKYLQFVNNRMPPSQNTPEWLKLRRGRVTASQADKLVSATGRTVKLGPEKLGLKLGEERLDPGRVGFRGNAHTREGNDGEGKAKRAFLRGEAGRGLLFEEAFFETDDKNFPGMGASPDGRLFNEEGGSEGLLELKFLSPGSMKGAAQKYMSQMQHQMAVTGEKKTHFYALDKITGAEIYETVYYDSEWGQMLKDKSQEAVALGLGLGRQEDARGMRERLDSTKSKNNRGWAPEGGVEVGPPKPGTTVYAHEEGSETPMYVYSGNSGSVVLDQRQLSDKQKYMHIRGQHGPAPNEGLDDLKDIITGESNNSKAKKEKKKADAEMKAAMQEEAAARREAAKELKNFRNVVESTKNVMVGLGQLATGAESVVENVLNEGRVGGDSGAAPEKMRGIRKLLESSNMSPNAIEATLSSVGKRQNQMTNAFSGVSETVRLKKAFSSHGGKFPEYDSSTVPSFYEQQSLTISERMEMEYAIINQGNSSQAKSFAAQQLGLPDGTVFSASKIEPNEFLNAWSDLPMENAEIVGATVAETRRALGEAGEDLLDLTPPEPLGHAMVAAQVAAGVAVTAGGGFALSKIIKTGRGLVKGGGPLTAAGNAGKSSLSAAAGGYWANVGAKGATGVAGAAGVSTAGAGAAVGAGAAGAGIVSKLLLAAKVASTGLASAVPSAIRYGLGVEDSGGLADSALDVGEFAGAGATLGLLGGPLSPLTVPIGAAAGAGVGVLNEVFEYATGGSVMDFIMPSEDIGEIKTASIGNDSVQVNNVDVDVRIDSNGYKVISNVNGEETLDEGTGVYT